MSEVKDLTSELEALSAQEAEAEAALRDMRARQTAVAKESRELDQAVSELARRRRELGRARKAAIGVALYDVLAQCGLHEALSQHCKSVTEHPAALRRVLMMTSSKSKETLGKSIVTAMARTLAEERSNVGS